MARPLRVEFPGAIYHVTARGDRREPIYFESGDFREFLELLGRVCERFHCVVYAYCLMTNHYHLLVETVDGNLSRGMRQLNGVYSQRFNRKHGLVGHLFQGRYHPILVQKEDYLLELARYVVLNPVRAGLVDRPEGWVWSSFAATIGKRPSPCWLEADWLLAQFGETRRQAVNRYRRFVAAGVDASDPFENVRHQLYLGDESFAERITAQNEGVSLSEVPRTQRRCLALSLAEYASRGPSRHKAMANAYRSGAYTMKQIAEYFGVHYMTVSRAVARSESELECEN